MLSIEAGVRHLCTPGRLVGAQSSDPSRGASKRATERLHFAQRAAGKAGFEGGTEAVHAVTRDKPLSAFPVRQ
jgi:hypothetical protein